MTKAQKVKANPRAEGVVLLRLGQLGVHHDDRHGALRALPHQRRRTGGVRARRRRRSQVHENLSVLGLSVSAGSLVFYVVTLGDRRLGVRAADRRRDRRPRRPKKTLMARLRLGRRGRGGADVLRHRHQLAARRGAARRGQPVLRAVLVVYDAILIEIAEPDERDRISSRGWALGYLGGGLLLAVNLALVTVKPFGLSTEMAVRISLLSAAIWWACFTFIPYRGIKDRAPAVSSRSRARR